MKTPLKYIIKLIHFVKNKFADYAYNFIMFISSYHCVKRIKVIEKISNYKFGFPRNIIQIPDHLKNNFNNEKNYNNKYVYILSDYNVSYHGVLFKNFRLFIPSLVHPKWNVQVINSMGTNIIQFLLKQWSKSVIKIEKTPVAVVHELWSSTNYYHWICDSLSRILILKENGFKCTILIPSNAPDYVKQTIRWFGYEDFLEIKKDDVYRLKNIVLPELTADIASQNKILINKVRETIINNYNITEKNHKIKDLFMKKIYSSRQLSLIRKIINEEDVITLLKNNGFHIIDFNDYSFIDQISIMTNANFLIGIHGANLTNMLFMEKHSTVIELMNKNSFNPCYYHLCTNLDMKYNYLACDADDSNDDDNNTNIIIDIQALSNLIEH